MARPIGIRYRSSDLDILYVYINDQLSDQRDESAHGPTAWEPDACLGSLEAIRERETVLSANMDKQLGPLSNINSFVVNVSNTSTAFAVRYLPFPPCCDGLASPPRFTSSTRSYVCRIQSAARDEEKAVQEGRGKHRVPLHYIPPPPERVSVTVHGDNRASSLLSSTSSSPLLLRGVVLPCGQPLMSSPPSRPFVRKSSPNWPVNVQSLQPAYPLARSVRPNLLPRKEPSPHSVPLPPLLFPRTSPSLKQANSVLPNERIASWSSMTKKA